MIAALAVAAGGLALAVGAVLVGVLRVCASPPNQPARLHTGPVVSVRRGLAAVAQ